MAIFVSQFLIPTSIEISWQTESEFDTAGFNILRGDSQTGPFTRINDSIIPGSADPILGGSYQFIDMNVEPGLIYYYRLEDVECDSTTRAHEVIEALPFYGADKRFGEGIGLGRSDRTAQPFSTV